MGRIAGGRTLAEDRFARALSLGPMRDKPVPDKDLRKLALDVLRDGGFRGAMDAETAGPADRVVEDALEEFEKFLATVLSGDDLRRAQELAVGLTTASERAAQLREAGGADGRRARDAEAEQRRAMDRRRLASDAAATSTLDRVLAGVRKPMRL